MCVCVCVCPRASARAPSRGWVPGGKWRPGAQPAARFPGDGGAGVRASGRTRAGLQEEEEEESADWRSPGRSLRGASRTSCASGGPALTATPPPVSLSEPAHRG